VSEAPTFMEWCRSGARWWCRPTLKVAATPCRCAPAPPSGCASRPLCQGVQRDSRNTLLATAPADSAETFTVTQRTARSTGTVACEGGRGGGPSVHACAVRAASFLGAKTFKSRGWGQIQPNPVDEPRSTDYYSLLSTQSHVLVRHLTLISLITPAAAARRRPPAPRAP
jgi:hypothetical protein